MVHMIRMVRRGKEKREEIYEPVEWPPKRREDREPPRRGEPSPNPERRRERRREKVPAK